MPEPDFVGTLTDDIAILSTPDDAPPSAETTAEPTSQTESPQRSERELTSNEITSLDSQRHQPKTPEPTDKPEQTEKQQATEKQQPEFEKPQADAESLEEAFPGGIEQAAQVIGKAAELGRVDAALESGTPSDMAGVVMNAFEQTGPERFPDVLQLAMNLLEDRAPAQFDALVNSLISERLKADGVWAGLEYLYSAAQQNPQAVPELLNRFAAGLMGYGIGPYDANAEAASMQDFSRAADETIIEYLDADIKRAAPPGFSSAPADLQAQFLRAVHEQVQTWAKGDPKLRDKISEVLSGGLSRRAGVKAVNLLLDKARAVIPGAVKLLSNQAEYSIFRNAPPPPPIDDKRDTLTPELAKQLSDKRIMGWRGPVARQRKQNTAEKKRVTRDEAKHLPFSRLLDEAIEVE